VFTFVLPVIDGTQSGTYTLESIYLTNIYGGPNNALYDGSTANGPNEQTETKPKYTVENNYYLRWLEMPLSELTNDSETDESRAASVTIVSSINIAFTDSDLNDDKVFGKDNNGNINATFGTVYNLDTLELSITAGSAKKPVSDYGLTVSSVDLKYAYDVTSVSTQNGITTNSFGGYTVAVDWSSIISSSKTYDYNSIAAVDGDNTLYRITTSNRELAVAGKYNAIGSLTINLTSQNGKAITVSKDVTTLNAPKYEIWTGAPTAKFISTDPDVNTSFDVDNGNGGTDPKKNIISADGLSAVCYFKAGKSEDCWGSLGCSGYTASQITAQIDNMGTSFNKASLTVVNNNNADDIVFEFSPTALTSKNAVGDGGNSRKFIGEKAKASQIIVTDSQNNTYTFNLPDEKCLYITCTQ